MAGEWFIGRNGERFGPYTEEQLREFTRTGSLGANDQVWVPSTSSWQAAGTVPGLFAGATPPPPGAGYPPPGSAYPPPGAGYPPPAVAAVGESVGPRFVATLIDFVIIIVFTGILVAIFGEDTATTTATSGDEGFEVSFELNGAPAFLSFLFFFAYYWLMEAFAGGTVGKLAVGLRVKMADGSPVTLGAAALRTVLRIIDGLFIYLVAAIFVWSTPRNQRLGDLAARTIVTRP